MSNNTQLFKKGLVQYLMNGNNFHNGEDKKKMNKDEAYAYFDSIENMEEIDVIDEELEYYNVTLGRNVTKEDLLNSNK